jgi:hypothetical protein
MNLGREFVDERVLRGHVEDGTIPLPPHFELISWGSGCVAKLSGVIFLPGPVQGTGRAAASHVTLHQA